MRYATTADEGRVIVGHHDGSWRAGPRGMTMHSVINGAFPEIARLTWTAFGGLAPENLAAPLRPKKIIGVGLNYLSTIREMGLPEPAEPYLFAKYSSSVVGPTDHIVIDSGLTARVDWEGELAVVIGTVARRVSTERALEHVFGYTIANDISARDLQERDPQWVRGKSLDTFCPLGPVIVTGQEIGDPQSLRIRTWVNNELVQDGSTSDMVFSVASLISHFSHSFTLEPGDVILTGTPPGCGDFMEPRRSLRDGDRVEVEIPGIGRLTNLVRESGSQGEGGR
jgi:2-keto-4-pentenoate hydratase/2-oxohepta-3-ene-1,7-dioic acid hydratase in catechol pathway